MKVSYYCGMNIGWGGFFTEPPECHSSGEIEVNEDEWVEGFVSFICPWCKTELNQSDGHFEELP